MVSYMFTVIYEIQTKRKLRFVEINKDKVSQIIKSNQKYLDITDDCIDAFKKLKLKTSGEKDDIELVLCVPIRKFSESIFQYTALFKIKNDTKYIRYNFVWDPSKKQLPADLYWVSLYFGAFAPYDKIPLSGQDSIAVFKANWSTLGLLCRKNLEVEDKQIELLSDSFEKFCEWDDKAIQMKPKPFSKIIVDKQDIKDKPSLFNWDGSKSMITLDGQTSANSGCKFDRKDAQQMIRAINLFHKGFEIAKEYIISELERNNMKEQLINTEFQ